MSDEFELAKRLLAPPAEPADFDLGVPVELPPPTIPVSLFSMSAFRRYRAKVAPKLMAIDMTTAKLLWPDRSDEEIRQALLAMGMEET